MKMDSKNVSRHSPAKMATKVKRTSEKPLTVKYLSARSQYREIRSARKMEEKKGERKEESERDMKSEQMRQIYRHEHKIVEKIKLLPVFLVAMGTDEEGGLSMVLYSFHYFPYK